MAELDPSLVPHTIGGVLGWVSTAALGLFTGWTQLRKGKIDESALVLGKWREMTEQHSVDLKDLREELRLERQENATLRGTIRSSDQRLRAAEGRIRELEDEVKGLRRQMQQSSESAVRKIAERPGEPIVQAAMAALDRVPEADAPLTDTPRRGRRARQERPSC